MMVRIGKIKAENEYVAVGLAGKEGKIGVVTTRPSSLDGGFWVDFQDSTGGIFNEDEVQIFYGEKHDQIVPEDCKPCQFFSSCWEEQDFTCRRSIKERLKLEKDKKLNKRRTKKAYSYTFSGWLRFIKKFSEDEIMLLWDDPKRCSELEDEYKKWEKERGSSST